MKTRFSSAAFLRRGRAGAAIGETATHYQRGETEDDVMAEAFKCAVCDLEEVRCQCDKYCAICQGEHNVRLCQDGAYYCQDCREICDFQAQN